MQAGGEFQQQSDQFMSWLRKQEGVKISPDIELTDLRARGAGRGVGQNHLFTYPTLHDNKLNGS